MPVTLDDLLIPPRPATSVAVRRSRGMPGFEPFPRRHQPWLPDAMPLKGVDDFSARSAVLPAGRVAVLLLLAALVLAMGRSAEMVDAAYGLDTLPGTETLIAVLEAWHRAMQWLGVPDALGWLRAHFALAE